MQCAEYISNHHFPYLLTVYIVFYLSSTPICCTHVTQTDGTEFLDYITWACPLWHSEPSVHEMQVRWKLVQMFASRWPSLQEVISIVLPVGHVESSRQTQFRCGSMGIVFRFAAV